MRIAICDDSQKEQKRMVNALRELYPTAEPECFSTGKELLRAAKEAPAFGVVFLDVYLTEENGMDIAKELMECSPETYVVFVTVSREHAVDAFSLSAVHYLVKPVDKEGLAEVFRRLETLRVKERTMITVSVGHESYAIYLDEICYVQSVSHAKEIYLTDGRKVRVWMSLDELELKLNHHFLKINRGTIVNMEQIYRIGSDSCVLQDGTNLEFARRERTRIRAIYNDYLFESLSRGKGYAGG